MFLRLLFWLAALALTVCLTAGGLLWLLWPSPAPPPPATKPRQNNKVQVRLHPPQLRAARLSGTSLPRETDQVRLSFGLVAVPKGTRVRALWESADQKFRGKRQLGG